MKLKLITFGTEECTIGKLYCNDALICKTIERRWRDNQASVSCIPEGVYKLIPTQSPKFGNSYCLVNEELGVTLNGPSKRTHILIHSANKASQLMGCIAPVSSFGIMDGEWAGFNSRAAKVRLFAKLNGDEHELEIIRN